MLASDIIPVIAPIATSEKGQTLNVNADVAAAHWPRTEGRAFVNADGCERRAGCQRAKLFRACRRHAPHANPQWHGKDGMIRNGNATAAVKNGVNATVILDGRVPHAILLELFTELGAGTLIE